MHLRRRVKTGPEYDFSLFGFFEADNPGKPRPAEELGFEADNYYTADEKRRMLNKQGNLVSGPFSKWIPN